MVCYDDSAAAKEAVRLALTRAKIMKAVVHIVISYSGALYDTSSEKDAKRVWKDVEKAEEALNEIKKSFDKDKIPCSTYVSVRNLEPGEDLVTYADENKIDEIIIGIQKTSKVGKLLFGSTAQYVILRAKCPVLTVK
ncbi:MAG: universal stress protein [Deltaproteobacteria bacterium]|nr:universal stress protein [Deltaproteobacteria bacterium]MBW2180914.1 universal stress protein [Deltaproteobacteria bacterium]